ncbi:MAG: hypothetical protein ACRC1I_17390 [Pseudomonas proteolytica]|uniref:hypothetical protein n=1 Tax=Pseudomonas proteolytica TaxID=219574 RepID=UPI003F374BF4
MQLTLSCVQCLQENGRPGGASHIEVRDDGCYMATCLSGHRTVTVLQQHKFGVLFEIGAHAILDGYYREAVSSFTSSLERFYEYTIRRFPELVAEEHNDPDGWAFFLGPAQQEPSSNCIIRAVKPSQGGHPIRAVGVVTT